MEPRAIFINASEDRANLFDLFWFRNSHYAFIQEINKLGTY